MSAAAPSSLRVAREGKASGRAKLFVAFARGLPLPSSITATLIRSPVRVARAMAVLPVAGSKPVASIEPSPDPALAGVNAEKVM